MPDAKEYVAFYVERLRQGDEDAFHVLIEPDASVLPLLIERVRQEGEQGDSGADFGVHLATSES